MQAKHLVLTSANARKPSHRAARRCCRHVLTETISRTGGGEERQRSYRYEHPTYARTQVDTTISSAAGSDIATELTGYGNNGNVVRTVDAEQRETTGSYDDRDQLVSLNATW